MAYFLFVDESGQDHRESPYEVLAGVAIEDRDLWNLVRAVQDAEILHFGARYTLGKDELKGKKLLKAKTYRLANQLPPIQVEERSELARQCLEAGDRAGRRQITALAQAKLSYVGDVLDICARFRCKAFASIVSPEAPSVPSADYLRKDYAYLFERFYYFSKIQIPVRLGLSSSMNLRKAEAISCSARWIATSNTPTRGDSGPARSFLSPSSSTAI